MSKIPMGWGETFANLPTGRVAADALIGGGLGMGANYAANSSSGDTGGYLQAGLIGAGAGAVTRGVLSKAGAEKAAAQYARSEIPDAILGPSMAKAMNGVKDLSVAIKDKSVSMYGSVRDSVGSNMSKASKAVVSGGNSGYADNLTTPHQLFPTRSMFKEHGADEFPMPPSKGQVIQDILDSNNARRNQNNRDMTSLGNIYQYQSKLN